ncbi:GGDEF domain-containing protein [Tumebacillus sp. ITR2]|uniref:GGDEF domain-containing protein n=1 Tax=Tumebacillus amylolyticus TaxID=2801339 RepID=A0ABS1J8G2_9BACL|nr:GGDEF domain-containing protein [Tumebacillus amylolyticus]MBL0386566.1 GGDEF domain-containing protein [Tumebacillus amylolyticus]
MEGSRGWFAKWLERGRSAEGERGSVVREVMKHHPLAKRMKKILQERQQIVFLYLDIVQFAELEKRVGERTAGDLLQLVESCIRRVSLRMFSEERLIDVENFWGDDFLICFSQSPGETRRLYEVATDVRLEIVREVNANRPVLLSSPIDLHIGYAALDNSGKALDRQLYQTIKSAVRMARKKAVGGDENLYEFRDLLMNRQIEAHFQPIISFDSGEPLGWEALARGPKGSRFERPDTLFSFAEEAGELFALEKVCRERAIERAQELPRGAKLFLNINPRTLDDPRFTKGETKRLLDLYGLSPSNIVFEITERHSIQDYSAFRKTLEHYRQQGYLIAVDDAGAGYSSLQSIVELCPDFIKMDMSLVRDVHNDPVKQALLEAFVTLAGKIRCKIIAEGIEKEEEVKTLLALGIDFGQGFLLGRPHAIIASSVPQGVLGQIERKRVERVLLSSGSMLQIGTIATPTYVMPSTATVKDVHELLENRRQLTSVVVAELGRPLGLITRDHLYAMLGSQYGVPLYYKRSVRQVMDTHPLMVEQHVMIDEVSSLATGRNNLKRYDDIIVTDEGEYRGVVSVQTLLDVMSKVKIEIAKYANPLTGLPGNLRIEEELRTRVRRGEAFSVLYVDLDHFKRFNDRCGFEHGDQMILFLSQLLRRQLSRYGGESDFLGHIGGDDFVVFTSLERCDLLGEETVKLFGRAVRLRLRQLLPPEQMVGLSLSIAAVDVAEDCGMDPTGVAELAAEMKRVAKVEVGDVYVRGVGGGGGRGSVELLR